MNEVVSYELAKLLKEKGFDEECWNYYTLAYGKKPYITQGIEYQSDAKIKFDWNCNNEHSKLIQAPYPNTYHISQSSAPSIAQVVDWVFQSHKIWIVVNVNIQNTWYFELFNLKDKRNAEILIDDEYWFNSPTEAYEAAIEYVLTKLI